jgi:hypothetical protein
VTRILGEGSPEGPVIQLGCTAIYARVSTETQSRASIDDQIRKYSQYAEAHGLKILEEHIYRDQALSEVGADRPAKAGSQLALSVPPRLQRSSSTTPAVSREPRKMLFRFSSV